ncbi:malonate decarboxylase holo-[acyl-carrier-protein] synthase [Pseudoduganella aquatica]|uniref:Malonate decarboxylase holo-[acyl-carrier-protein] synthase n=1 Tax=Pseudoduganella aquatica TaxID=2660641 RepID=A0A7X4H9A5_9BURK|nr:malonate decarboxylase holo-[acyl-carrier-protein] synthase [Pseudoduganella aquatica]MYN06292.1 malonate decarboxylase holo-[acyl-carrier-protein] synthase [Pseudoduganella aquatica]
MMYKRHDLIWLTRAGWQAALAAQPAQEAVLRHWRDEDWPVVVRRREPGIGSAAASAAKAATDVAEPESEAGQDVFAGIALPPDSTGAKPRIALRVAAAHIERSTAPLTLKAARPALPAHWRPGYTELQRLSAGLDLRVYGSLAWQALTSLRCLTDSSDIDILFRPLTRQQLQAGLALLSGAAHGLPLDGEIMFPSGQAVSWKEWLSASAAQARVLVKTTDSVHLAAPDELLATLRPA